MPAQQNDPAPDAAPGPPRPRLPKLAVAGLTPGQRVVYDAITGGRRGAGPQLFQLRDEQGALEGPFNAMLYDPATGAALQALGSAIRYDSPLPGRLREIAILVVAAHWGSAFERYAHEAVARAAGIGDGDLGSLRELAVGRLADPRERLVAATTLALARDGDLDDAGYAAAVAGLGVAQVVALTTLVGYYATLALQLRVFRVPAPG
jgi:4-carboxymuconolactone decarboxylase